MDYGRVLRRAWEITWRWKALWILGLLASLGYLINLAGLVRIALPAGPDASTGASTEAPGWFDIVTCLTLIFSIGSVVVRLIVQGGLIAGVQYVAGGGFTSFPLAWRAGRKHLGVIFAIAFLAASPIIATLLTSLCITAILGIGLAVTSPYEGGETLRIAIPILVGVILLAAAIVYLVFTFASRAAVMEDMLWIEAFRTGWEMLRAHLGPILLLSLTLLAMGIPVSLVIGAPALATILSSPSASLTTRLLETPAWAVVAVAVLGLTIGSIFQTYVSAAWTLAYRQLAGLEWTPGMPAVRERFRT